MMMPAQVQALWKKFGKLGIVPPTKVALDAIRGDQDGAVEVFLQVCGCCFWVDFFWKDKYG
jgi:hypothetical protein